MLIQLLRNGGGTMEFRNDFIQKTKEIYKNSVIKNIAYHKICNTLESYFLELKESLKREIEVASGEFDIKIMKYEKIEVNLNQSQLVIEIDGFQVNINVKYYDDLKNEQIDKRIDRLYYTNGVLKSEVFQITFTRSLIDNYLAIAFRKAIDELSVNSE
jgi:hypothetical protein